MTERTCIYLVRNGGPIHMCRKPLPEGNFYVCDEHAIAYERDAAEDERAPATCGGCGLAEECSCDTRPERD